MRTERDRARSLADVFVGPRCKGVGHSGPSIVFASKPTYLPSLRDHLSFVGRRKYRTRCDCQFARHICLHMSPFQLVKGVKMSTGKQEPTVAGQRNMMVLCEKVNAHLP